MLVDGRELEDTLDEEGRLAADQEVEYIFDDTDDLDEEAAADEDFVAVEV